MKSSFCIDLQRFMLIPTKFPLTHKIFVVDLSQYKMKKRHNPLLKNLLCRY